MDGLEYGFRKEFVFHLLQVVLRLLRKDHFSEECISVIRLSESIVTLLPSVFLFLLLLNLDLIRRHGRVLQEVQVTIIHAVDVVLKLQCAPVFVVLGDG